MLRSKLRAALMSSALCVVASSCASKDETHLAFPPAADLLVEAEPAYPAAALEPGPAGAAAEAQWWNSVLLWGRAHHDRVRRVCEWARALKAELPPEQCGQ